MVMVLTDVNLGDMYGVIYLASRLGVGSLVLNPFIAAGHGSALAASLSVQRSSRELYELLADMLACSKELGVVLTTGAPFRDPSLNRLFGGPPEKLEEMKLTLDLDFNVKPCSSASESFGPIDQFLQSPVSLEAAYLRFWKHPTALAGCVCSQLSVKRA